MMEEFTLYEVWRLQNPSKKEFSWFKRGNITKASRIDLTLVSAGLDQQVEMIQYISGIMTDHRAIYMVVKTNSLQRGIGYWKLNNTYLTEIDYVNSINQSISQSISTSMDKNPGEVWETIKAKIKEASQQYARQRVSEDKIIISQLSEQVNEYEANLPLNQRETQLWQETKEELEEKLMEKAKGIMFRSKAKWYEAGRKINKILLFTRKSEYNAKTCYKIIEDGKEYTEIGEILGKQHEFYTQLYSRDEDVEFTLQNDYGIVVPEECKKIQNQNITLDELQTALSTMSNNSNNKTPGEDGLPADLYKVFWVKLKQPFLDMVDYMYNHRKLHESAKRGILNLIPKGNKDSRYIKNLRPITLLNTDYKIIEKVIANKMLPALQHIINKDQRGFMKERRISVNIRKMLDIIHCVDQEDLEAVVLSLDFVKCFDKCSFSILHGSLDFFEFGSVVRNWTKILYDDFTVKIQNNGHFSQKIPINKGVHQGGCCSSVYFLVIAEILALALRSNQDIEGITIKDIRNLLNQFADDMDIFTLSSEKSIKAIYEELDKFKRHSGFTVSYEKTTMYRIGSLRHSNAEMYGMSQYVWSNQSIQVLGVTIAHEDLIYQNYQGIIEKVKRTLNSWHHRGLSLLGKVQVINTLVASLFVYKMMVLPAIPSYVVKNIDNQIREYLWKGKKSKIALNILKLQKNQGRAGLVDLKKKDISLKATWPYILSTEPEYAGLVHHLMHMSHLGENIWRCNLAPEDISQFKTMESFWKDVLYSWSQYNFFASKRIENQIIWYNSEFRIGNKPFFWNDVFQRGLIYVHQLFEGCCFKSSQQMKEEYGLTEVRFYGLKTALPKVWKTFFKENTKESFFPLPPHNYDICIATKGKGWSKRVYKYISEDATIMINKWHKWNQELQEDIAEDVFEFAALHQGIYSVTNITKYRSFQYRLLQRGLVTNVHLCYWHMTDTNLCSFCQRSKETVVHLLYECPLVYPLWEEFATFIKKDFKVEVTELSAKLIITNQLMPRKGSIVNFLCLVLKQYVYAKRCMGQQPNFTEYRRKVRQLENIEKYIATKNNKVSKHRMKWCRESLT